MVSPALADYPRPGTGDPAVTWLCDSISLERNSREGGMCEERVCRDVVGAPRSVEERKESSPDGQAIRGEHEGTGLCERATAPDP
ncbi:hypothetical protein GCM10009660_51230 [Catellatospora bangladeshensis]